MGLIKAAAKAIGGTLHDQWLDAIRCPDMPNDILMTKVQAPNGNAGVISKGSRIIVNPSQAALIVDNGAIVDACAEEGAYTFDQSSSATCMYGGDFGGMFKEMWERFKYGGGIAKEQAVYFINLKEIIGNLFGTPAPIPYSDWGHPNVNPRTSSLYGMSVKIKVFGKYTFRISDPFRFVHQIGGTASQYTKEQLTEQIASELLSSFRNTLAELGSETYQVPALDLPHKDDEIIALMKEKHYDGAITERGVTILSISAEGITFDEASQEKIDQYELSDEYTKSAYLARAQGEALKNAAENPAGAGNTLLGVGLGFGAAGINPMQQMQSNNRNERTAVGGADFEQKVAEANHKRRASSAERDRWTCACGTHNTGKFCSECGKKQPEEGAAKETWTCPQCGHLADGKFCPECGQKRPQDDAWTCSCGAHNTGNFCTECGNQKADHS